MIKVKTRTRRMTPARRCPKLQTYLEPEVMQRLKQVAIARRMSVAAISERLLQNALILGTIPTGQQGG